MGWFTKKKATAVPVEQSAQEIWTQCPACKAHVSKEEWDKTFKVCPRCNFHERITARERVDLLIDPKTFTELYPKIKPSDPLGFVDGKGRYADKIEEARQKTGMNESVLTGYGQLSRIKVALAVMDFRFLGGSLAGSTGEKILLTSTFALKHRMPYIIVSASGGARMHEGIISLMQMAKTCAGIARLQEANIPFISVLTDPTTGGVSASFAMVGDIHIAEPGALIGFAGRRVIEETIKQKLPDDFQKAEYLLDHGFVDLIIRRDQMKQTIASLLRYYRR
jgi:acetyl-CoA carboxylase carboxyl transferase subunit beta